MIQRRFYLPTLIIAALTLATSQDIAGVQTPDASSLNSGFLGPVVKNVVILPFSVIDKKTNLVTGLLANEFTVLEDGQEQKIRFFSADDTPVSIGVLMDDSGSMRPKRERAAQMAMELLAACNPLDEFLVVKFNENAYVDQDFTSNLGRIRQGLALGSSRSGTALYDSLMATSNHMLKTGKNQRKILIVISDGDDNESRTKLPELLRDLRGIDRPVVYAIGLLKEDGPAMSRGQHTLETLGAETGGGAFFPHTADEMHKIALSIAAEIRNQYIIGYSSSSSAGADRYHKLKVTVGRKDVTLHARSGYVLQQPPSPAINRSK